MQGDLLWLRVQLSKVVGLCWLRIAPRRSKSPRVHTLLRAGAGTDPLQLSRLTHLARPEPALLNSSLTSLCPWHGEPTKQVAAQGEKMMDGRRLPVKLCFISINQHNFIYGAFIYLFHLLSCDAQLTDASM